MVLTRKREYPGGRITVVLDSRDLILLASSNLQRKRAAEAGRFMCQKFSTPSRLRVGAALERGAVVVGAGWVVASGLLLGLLGFRAQRRFAWGVVRDLAREHDVAQAGLHGIEFGGGDD